ncbi:MAG: hypothetical protein JNK05_16050 [Myxococcales bacterium]|nr:hypothetical protein [Myxococcales bacterium]
MQSLRVAREIVRYTERVSSRLTRFANRALWLAVVAIAVSVAGCPPGNVPPRDGGRACMSTAQCNSNGATCGVVFECVVGVCAETTVVKACTDGGYPPNDASTGECLVSEDCNAPGACGPIVACINYVCDREGPRINIPCPDGGAEDTGVGASDASDVATD